MLCCAMLCHGMVRRVLHVCAHVCPIANEYVFAEAYVNASAYACVLYMFVCMCMCMCMRMWRLPLASWPLLIDTLLSLPFDPFFWEMCHSIWTPPLASRPLLIDTDLSLPFQTAITAWGHATIYHRHLPPRPRPLLIDTHLSLPLQIAAAV